MKFHKILGTWAAAISALSIMIGAFATQALAQDDEEIEEIIVEGSLRSLPTQDVGSVFGFDKTVLETPRSASTVSSEQIERFGISDIDDFVALAPGTFTQSFFGTNGLDVRGTAGETYFRGVRRLDNPGNYPTPIGASDRVDIVRGPASPIYGPSKIGGYLNFVPKSARADTGAYLDEAEGSISYTLGSWDKSVMTAEVGGPGELGGQEFGYYLYGMIEDSDSYYINSYTDQTLLQASFDIDVNDNLHIQFGGMYHQYAGTQVAGWNRLTQDLIDTGTYITGTAQPLDTDGDGFISHAEYDATADFDDTDGDGAFGVNPFVFRPEFVTVGDLDSLMALENVGTTTLDGSQVLVAIDDILASTVKTWYFDIIYETDGGWEFKNQLFYETYDNLGENAYGFSQFHDTYVIEDKFVISKIVETGSLTSSFQFSPSYRYTDFRHADDYKNEYFHRRDLTGPSTALDRRLLSTRIDDDYTEYYIGNYSNFGAAALADFTWENGLSILVGARWDTIDMESHIPLDKIMLFNFSSGFVLLSDDGRFLLNDFVDTANVDPATITAPVDASDTEDGVSWTASLSWQLGNFIPYVTSSEQSTIVAGQGAEITAGAIFSNGAFDTSELFEYGIKGSFLDDTLYMALSIYEQERTDFNAQQIVTNQVTNTEGLEFEARWVATENLVLTLGFSNMEVQNLTTLANGVNFSFYGAEDMPQIAPELHYGGQVIGFPDGAVVNPRAIRAGVPENIISFTGTYAFDNGWAVNASIIDVDEAFSGYSQQVLLPSYTLVNLGLVYETENWLFSITGKNLTDERYFRANFPNLFGGTIVLPELPRNVLATIKYNF
ncbi:MAG: TonB-dependent receptor [Woeseiaceae bacterium]|nr:TonB-dependent receptor [Woeseiaceae bacterium]